MGGLVGGDYGSISYGAQGNAINSVVMNGKVYVNMPVLTSLNALI